MEQYFGPTVTATTQHIILVYEKHHRSGQHTGYVIKTLHFGKRVSGVHRSGSVNMKSVPRKPVSEEMLTNIKKHLKDYVVVGSASSPSRLPQFENLFPDPVRTTGNYILLDTVPINQFLPSNSRCGFDLTPFSPQLW